MLFRSTLQVRGKITEINQFTLLSAKSVKEIDLSANYESEGRTFESFRARHFLLIKSVLSVGACLALVAFAVDRNRSGASSLRLRRDPVPAVA